MSGRPVIHIARECSHVVGRGGVADVVLQLAKKCAAEGCPTTIIVPRYGKMDLPEEVIRAEKPTEALSIPLGYADCPERTERVSFRETDLHLGHGVVRLCLVEASRFRGKSHPYLYQPEEVDRFHCWSPDDALFCGAERPPADAVRTGAGHYDFFAMNVLLQKAALEYIRSRELADAVIHAHDAHAATLPLLVRGTSRYEEPEPARSTFVVTAHNCGWVYRQRCDDLRFVRAIFDTDMSTVQRCVVEGAFDPLGAAVLFADHLTTVSEGYAWEVNQGGASSWPSGCDGDVWAFAEFLVRHQRRLIGITNGIDPELKGPEALPEPLRPADVSPEDFGWKAKLKVTFLGRLNRIPREWNVDRGAVFGDLRGVGPDDCLFCFIGRLVAQKGPDIMIRAAEEVMAFDEHTGLCVVGDGLESPARRELEKLADRFVGRVIVLPNFSESAAAEAYAAGDFLLVPSRFEPCGMVDYIAQLHGNLPIANQVGGLSKIIDGRTGLGYFGLTDRDNLRGLVGAMLRGLVLFGNRSRLAEMRTAAARHVRANHTWDAVFPQYRGLYGLDGGSTP